MQVSLIPFIKNVLSKKKPFSAYNLKNKHKSALLGLFETLNFLEVVGKDRNAKSYKKSSNIEQEFELIKKRVPEDIAQLSLIFAILEAKKLPNDNYNGKEIRKIFKKSSKIIIYLLFRNGLIYKDKKSYSYSDLFFHLNKQNKEEKNKLFNSFMTYYDNKNQNIYLQSFRSIKNNPDHISISYDHGLSFRTKWILKHCFKHKEKKKMQKLESLSEKNRRLIFFEGDRTTNTAKAFVTIFPLIIGREEE